MWFTITPILTWLGLKKEREASLREVVDEGLKQLGLELHPKRAKYLSREQMRKTAEYIAKLSDGKFTEEEVIKELIRRGYTSIPPKKPEYYTTEPSKGGFVVPLILIGLLTYAFSRQ